jgi:hypothetical protein
MNVVVGTGEVGVFSGESVLVGAGVTGISEGRGEPIGAEVTGGDVAIGVPSDGSPGAQLTASITTSVNPSHPENR